MIEITTKELQNELWPIISTLSQSSITPSFKLRRLFSKAERNQVSEVKAIEEEQETIIKKYFKKVNKISGAIHYSELLEDVSKEDFEKEIKQFDEQVIEIECVKMLASALEQVVLLLNGEKIPMPGHYITVLDKYEFIDWDIDKEEPKPPTKKPEVVK